MSVKTRKKFEVRSEVPGLPPTLSELPHYAQRVARVVKKGAELQLINEYLAKFVGGVTYRRKCRDNRTCGCSSISFELNLMFFGGLKASSKSCALNAAAVEDHICSHARCGRLT